jgi:hypothetical protein
MIVFELKCGAGHRFEAWFRDGAAYDAQAREGTVSCPVCGDTSVSKAPMAPRIGKGGLAAEDRRREIHAEAQKQLTELRSAIEKNFDYVGNRFAEEARRIHYGEVDPRGIYGETTPEEAKELEEEGVACHQVPWLQRTDS